MITILTHFNDDKFQNYNIDVGGITGVFAIASGSRAKGEKRIPQWNMNDEGYNMTSTSEHLQGQTTHVPETTHWKEKMADGSYYGWREYMESERYKLQPDKGK